MKIAIISLVTLPIWYGCLYIFNLFGLLSKNMAFTGFMIMPYMAIFLSCLSIAVIVRRSPGILLAVAGLLLNLGFIFYILNALRGAHF